MIHYSHYRYDNMRERKITCGALPYHSQRLHLGHQLGLQAVGYRGSQGKSPFFHEAKDLWERLETRRVEVGPPRSLPSLAASLSDGRVERSLSVGLQHRQRAIRAGLPLSPSLSLTTRSSQAL